MTIAKPATWRVRASSARRTCRNFARIGTREIYALGSALPQRADRFGDSSLAGVRRLGAISKEHGGGLGRIHSGRHQSATKHLQAWRLTGGGSGGEDLR